MRLPVILACCPLLLALSAQVASEVPSPPPAAPSVEKSTPAPFSSDQVLVAFKAGISSTAIAETHRLANGHAVKIIKQLGIQVVAIPANTVQETLALYRRNPNVRYAEPNYFRLLSPPQPTLIPGEGSGPLLGDYFPQQWGLHNTGQPFYYFNLMSGTVDADIDAPLGWDSVEAMGASLGNPEVKVAILDTGVDCGHVDLLDDNGAIKCSDTINYTGSSTAGDAYGHGTHVAGIIAANANNSLGVAGVAELALLGSFKVCDDGGVCPDDAIISGITDASLAGYDVINMSFGGPDGSQALEDAVEFAWESGVVLVSSAGNDGSTSVGYPAGLARVIAVAASDANDNRASFSNYGEQVSVTAPGDTILSTMPMDLCPGDPEGCYEFLSGTSMSGPHVSGIAALVFARADVSTNEQVRFIIENSAEKTGAAGQNLLGWTQYGRVNLAGALDYATQGGNIPPSASFYYACVGLNCNFDAGDSSDADGDITNYSWAFGDGNSASGVSANHTFGAGGTYTVTLTVTDNLDATDSISKQTTVTTPSNTPPVAAFSYTCDGRSCTFDGTASSDVDPGDNITQYNWNFGSSGTQQGSGAIVRYDYDSSGTYAVALSVTDSTGATDTASTTVRVKDKGKSSGDSAPTDGEPTDPGTFCQRKPDHPKCQ